MKNIERQVLEAIDYNGMLEFIDELVSISSYDGKETLAQEHMSQSLQEMGFNVDTWMIDFNELSQYPDFSMAIPRKEGLGVVGSFGEGEKRIVLCGHIDTVSPGDLRNWKYEAMKTTLIDGRLYGRGTCDMKGGIACGVYAIKAIMDAGVNLKGKVIIESVIGEEDGGPGALATCLKGYKGDIGIVMEPTEVKIAPSISGAISFTVTIFGKSTHACVREEGVSAIEKFTLIQKALMELEQERNNRINDPLYNRYSTPYAINIGTIEGGQWPGTVPEKVVFKARIGVSVDETKEQVKQELEDKIIEASKKDQWLRENPPLVKWDGYEFSSSKIPTDHPMIHLIQESYKDACEETPVLEGMTYASDARYLIKVAGTPTIAFGPGDVRLAHAPNEYVPVEDLKKTVRTLALMIMRFLGYEDLD
jgi:acetylornithine deacetylase